MARAPLHALVFPYRFAPDGEPEYAIFKRIEATGGFWQAISGGAEDDETPVEAARRESLEEAGIPVDSTFMRLDSMVTIPVVGIRGFLWGDQVLVVTEHSFGVHVQSQEIRLSAEHTEFRWVHYEAAHGLLKWDSNKNALWELDFRLSRGERSRE